MRIFLALSLALFLFTPCWAGPGGFQDNSPGVGGGGFQGPGGSAGVTTVAQAKKAWDDTPVVLTGHIVSRAGGDHEHYIFRDSTGEIVVDIDDKLFYGRTVTPQTTVRLYGEVDKEMMERTKIDVKRLDIQ
ncbi:MAG: NirD/YgiW/YdeI family stress tolerance protein [Desulfovibrionaceae bacterium]|nr:NirD/YgiW/YdeI family stress tolerance protein [Desulfovibrionaceae bacterium]